MDIAFTGDVFLGGELEDFPLALISNATAFRNADARVVNLEQAASDNETVADKSTLYTGTAALTRLVDLQVDIAGLANNHIHDKGLNGIASTIAAVRSTGVRTVGAGKTLALARESTRLDRKYVLLAYCDFARPYLKQVATATDSLPGTAPLRIETIEADLAKLKPGDQAVLLLHWGQEHLRLPPRHDIALAKQLLADPRVAGIVGMHAHRIQGMITHGNKRAYMCLGNFLFPNFYVAPPAQIVPRPTKPQSPMVTRRYHTVAAVTHKKWLRVNRTSLIVNFDTCTGKFSHSVVVQEDALPVVRDARPLEAQLHLLIFSALSALYRIHPLSYQLLQVADAALRSRYWILRTRLTKAQHLGIGKTVRLILSQQHSKSSTRGVT